MRVRQALLSLQATTAGGTDSSTRRPARAVLQLVLTPVLSLEGQSNPGHCKGDGVLVSGAGARPPLGHELQRDRRPMLTIALAVQTPSAGRSLSTASARTRSG